MLLSEAFKRAQELAEMRDEFDHPQFGPAAVLFKTVTADGRAALICVFGDGRVREVPLEQRFWMNDIRKIVAFYTRLPEICSVEKL